MRIDILSSLPHLLNTPFTTSILAKAIEKKIVEIHIHDLRDYAKNNKLTWREDKTNKENKYSRNMIRNKLIPIISEINPSFKKSVLESSKRIELVNNFIKRQLERFSNIKLPFELVLACESHRSPLDTIRLKLQLQILMAQRSFILVNLD